ncbi:TrbG/VirB9 family P-type conjugative transfer protein [Thauera sp. 27]|uniref:TrbG/VirB9 family P-type conjugative transfer protein n=1 Tax=Thauera sp. 27 TaxID=305700 RepID=UPI0009F9897D|nr:TrbG/VirB9 family P-type conjugative transfer protein [Thauera sp. 27]
MKKVALGVAMTLLSALSVPPALAESRPIALPNDSRLIEFVYRPNEMYTILSRPEAVTNIQLSDDEELVTLAMGDTAQWVVSNTQGHIFIKPVFSDLVTSATLVTTKRTYQLTLRSSPPDGKFYQQVSWHNPQLIAYRNEQARARVVAAELDTKFREARLASTVVSEDVSLEKLNFDYSISGKADFAPSTVFDDGKFTWLRLGNVQQMPAVFMINESKDVELLNFTLRDNYIVIPRIVPGVLLKLGKQEVKITRGKSRSWFATSNASDFNFGGY